MKKERKKKNYLNIGQNSGKQSKSYSNKVNAESMKGNLKDVLVIQENFSQNTGWTPANPSTAQNNNKP